MLTGLVRTPLQIHEYKAKCCDSDLLGVVEKTGGQDARTRASFQRSRLETLADTQPRTPADSPLPVLQAGALIYPTAPSGDPGPHRQAKA